MNRMILVLSLLPTTAFGAVIAVPADQPTLQDAITNSAAGDVISLAGGTYDVDVTIPHNLTIEGVDGETVILTNTSTTSGQILLIPAAVTRFILRDVFIGPSNDNRAITSTGAHRIDVNNVSASSLSTAGDGAFLKATDTPNVNLDGVNIIGVTAANGGAVYIDQTDATSTNGNLRISDSTLESGEVTGSGGLIFANNFAVTITDSILSDGTATYGGAIAMTGTDTMRALTVNTSEISGSYAFELGGGVYALNSGLTMQDSTISNNSAGSGGGLWLDQATQTTAVASIRNNANFIGNYAHGLGSTPEGMEGSGSAFHVAARQVSFTTGVTVSNNFGTTSTAHASVTTGSISGLTMESNEATGAHGGLFLDTTGQLTIQRSTFRGNVSGSEGAGLSVAGGNLNLNTSTFESNVTAGDGGGAWFGGDVVATMDEDHFADNQAVRGGALFQDAGAVVRSLTVTDATIYRNQADEGGGFWVTGIDELNLRNNHWCENSAGTPGIGGAAYFAGTGSVAVANDALNDNTAISGGGYAFSGFGDVDVQFSTFAGNSATDGAAIDVDGIAGNTVLSHLAVTGSTGILFDATNAATLTPTRIGTTGNAGALLGGDWATETVTPVVLDDPYLYNNHPAASCEETRLYPHARNVSLRGDDAADPVVEDIGISGGTFADILLYRDLDGDGFLKIDDCGQDDDRDVNPDAVDVCDGIDNDCDAQAVEVPGTGIDEDPDTIWYLDGDSDGFGTDATVWPEPSCDAPEVGYVDDGTDCLDTDPDINPGADEVCDTVDNDCDELVDVNAIDAQAFYLDDDLDGFGDATITVSECVQPDGYVSDDTDCDDTLASVFPGAIERCDTIDNDCDGEVDVGAINAPLWYPDTDNDGYGDDTLPGVESCLPPLDHSPFVGDCDDTDPDRNPGADEVCDGIDNNCDDQTDVDPIEPIYYPDNDNDGFGDRDATPVASCTPVAGLLLDGSDCDDTNPNIKPGAVETCDNVDEDCDGEADDNPAGGFTYYLDADFDGYGNPAFTRQACTLPNGYTEDGTDCDDQEPNANPGVEEQCDQIDNDCDGDIDEPDAVDATLWYADVDDDNYGDPDATRLGCTAPIGHVPQGGDCDDLNPSAFPGRPEVCDQVDNDCDGEVDGPEAADVSFFFADADGDGYGDPDSELGACFQPEGYTTDDTDCDDSDENVNPGALEVANNGIDDNCDGQQINEDTGTAPTDEPGDEGCGDGCSSSSGGSSFAVLPFLGALLLRRRR